ncbi:TetR/AcrR family transcriptional regulator [Nocardioides mangrovicus]|uniref:TetR/AcrR family transcriptional regulator n=1 Tax=Nocardioides mangrovicus TaxID=2478913 RepID=A0A3L8P2I7_9ACTN|nr:helix-turn-helix domain-containing protein [Nocardioides mangrovicus]RLV49197.1 TetR/AcrR family transcriptional regulator [Nocardioides mangrovicus]
MRADAQRNRERIIEVARAIFREQGYDASLDLVAKQAGVGAGTLYRHFPNRESLVDAVMQVWVDRVNDTAGKAMAREGAPRDVLVGWFADYVALISLHKGGPAKLTCAMGDETSPIRTKCQVLSEAMRTVLSDLEDDLVVPVDALQACRLVGGVATVADQADLDAEAVRPMLEVVADGFLARG